MIYKNYGDWVISYYPSPSPCAYDWTYAHVDYDGASDSGDTRCGYATSFADAVARINEEQEMSK